MTIPEPISLIAGAVTEAVFGYILEQSGWAEEIRRRLRQDPERLAFQRALEQALDAFGRDHAEWQASLLDASFLQREGAPILAEFLRPAGEPDAALLAERWAASLRSSDDPRRHELTAQCEPAAYTLLALLGKALKDQAALRDLNNERRFEQIATDMHALLAAQGAGRATPVTRRAYLRWLVDRNLYLDAHGVMQTQRQVQLKLDEIYVSLAAQPEPEPASRDRRLWEEEQARLESEMDAAGLTGDEREDRRDLFLSRTPLPPPRSAPAELHALVRQGTHLAVLGDPGSGKTTLLRYLALHQAQALLAGRRPGDPHPKPELGAVRFPVLLRIADYVEVSPGAGKALSDLLGEISRRAECPAQGLQELLTAELAAGGCLLLLDGLDEIVSADDRRKVVTAIENFVRRYQAGGPRGTNHFLVTSRSAGYRSAPLAPPFAHYVVQEMDEAQIRRFLERWCGAVEDAETPDKSPEARRANAEAEVKAILDAVQHNPGVRRLAGNPLLLRILALIHRTGKTLPQRRIELYKLAADTLARTWRTAQGVPESALVEDRFLTPLLGKLAYWMHLNKPSGLATEREVYDLLGKEYARLKGLAWDEGGDNPLVAVEVEKFLRAVREHTGLFVERAPRRYGFMHLTFEEYYAARDLVARPRETARRLRQHLHDPRWDEPILLALGFVGLDYPEEAAALVDTAILAQGEEAQSLGFTPSPYEEWLGRDYRFALRCAGDLIPLVSHTLAALASRLEGELLRRERLARFDAYRQVLGELLPLVATSALGERVICVLTTELHVHSWYVRLNAAASLGQLGQATSEVLDGLLAALSDNDLDLRMTAAASLGQLGQATSEVLNGLLTALSDKESNLRSSAALSLGRLRRATPEVVAGLLTALSDNNTDVRSSAVASLGSLGQAFPEVVSGLHLVLRDEDKNVRSHAAASLSQLGQATPELVAGLLAALREGKAYERVNLVESLGQLGQASTEVLNALLETLGDTNWFVRSSAATSLGQLGRVTPEVMGALLAALSDPDSNVRARAVVSLGQLKQATPDVVSSLLAALHADKDKYVRNRAAASLGQLGHATLEVVNGLLSALGDDDKYVRDRAAMSLGQSGHATPEVIAGLLAALSDKHWFVRSSAAASLGQLGHPTPTLWAEPLFIGLAHYERSVNFRAAECLVQLGKYNPTVRQEIMRHAITILDASIEHNEAYMVLLQLASL